MPHRCPVIPPEKLREYKANLARHRIENPIRPITAAAIAQALAYPETPYFMTTNLYWDCNCDSNFIRPSGMSMCEDCGAWRDESPDSRINELRDDGIHVDWLDPKAMATLEEYSTAYRRD